MKESEGLVYRGPFIKKEESIISLVKRVGDAPKGFMNFMSVKWYHLTDKNVKAARSLQYSLPIIWIFSTQGLDRKSETIEKVQNHMGQRVDFEIRWTYEINKYDSRPFSRGMATWGQWGSFSGLSSNLLPHYQTLAWVMFVVSSRYPNYWSGLEKQKVAVVHEASFIFWITDWRMDIYSGFILASVQ